jgi:hypothetical protein
MYTFARFFVVLCALGSLACTLYAGQHNRSVLLVGMFAVWVVAPFAGLLMFLRSTYRKSPQAGSPIPLFSTILSMAAMTILAVFTLHPQSHNAAAPFLMVPAWLWLAIALMSLSARRKHTQSPR